MSTFAVLTAGTFGFAFLLFLGMAAAEWWEKRKARKT